MACVLGTNVVGDRPVDCQAVVDEEFLSGCDSGERVNEHPLARLDGFAVRGAGMIQEAGAVATPAAVDHTPIGKLAR